MLPILKEMICNLQQQGASLQAQNAAAELKVRAEFHAGRLLREIEKQRGGVRDSMGLQNETPLPPTLTALGLTKSQSHRWQTMAILAEDALEHYLATAKEKDADITSVGIYRLAKDQQQAEHKAAVQSQAHETCMVTDLSILIIKESDLARSLWAPKRLQLSRRCLASAL